MPNRYVTWREIEDYSKRLATKVNFRKWAGIISVSRGGLVPTAIIANYLGIYKIATLAVTSRHGDLTQSLVIDKLGGKPPYYDGKDYLIIDDLVDTGATAKAVSLQLPKADYACLFAKPMGRSFAQHYIEEIPQDIWLDFPWEVPHGR